MERIPDFFANTVSKGKSYSYARQTKLLVNTIKLQKTTSYLVISGGNCVLGRSYIQTSTNIPIIFFCCVVTLPVLGVIMTNINHWSLPTVTHHMIKGHIQNYIISYLSDIIRQSIVRHLHNTQYKVTHYILAFITKNILHFPLLGYIVSIQVE